MAKGISTLIENISFPSGFLDRNVVVDFYLPATSTGSSSVNLLLINDGQLMEEMELSKLLEEFYTNNNTVPLLCVAIHAGNERKMEYGIASEPDYKSRGSKAGLYTSFVLGELLPYISFKYPDYWIKEKVFAGFSLGGLTAMDIVWNNPDVFSKAGVFSGSFWWRSLDQEDKAYDDDKHRIMHQLIKKDNYKPGLKFFLQCGNLDELRDRNKNGVIDSIDDTLDIVSELMSKGYDRYKDIFYLELKEGRHDAQTWSKVLPVFLRISSL